MIIDLGKIEQKLFFLLGLFTSMALLQIQIGAIGLSPFNFILYITFTVELFISKISNPNKEGYIYLAYLICITFSAFINYSSLPKAWGIANFTAVFNSWILGYFLVFFNESKKRYVKQAFISGLKVNAWIQLIWGGMQYILYQSTGQSLNQVVFGDWLHMPTNYTYTNIYNGINRLTGLNWEPAFFGLSLIIGFLLSNKLWHKILFIIGIIASASRTSLLVLIAVILVGFIYDLIQKKKTSLNINPDQIVISILLVLIVLILVIGSWNSISKTLFTTLTRFQNMNFDPSSRVHNFYYQVIWDLLFNKFSVLQLFFGIGAASSGYPYSFYYGLYPQFIVKPWSIEDGLADIIVGSGLIGVVLVYLWFINKAWVARKNKAAFLLIVGILVGAVTYNYFVNWIWMVVMFMSVPSINNNN